MTDKQTNEEMVYCGRCPIVEVCYGQNCPPDTTEPRQNCILARLYMGDIKIETSGYISR